MEFLMYPFIAAFGVSDELVSIVNYTAYGLAFFFVMDISLNFFKAVKKDNYEYITEPDIIHQLYFKGSFPFDAIIAIPFGTLLSHLHPSLIALDLLKVFRLMTVNEFFSPNQCNKNVRAVFQVKLMKVI